MTRNIVLICLDSVRKDYFDEYAPRLRSKAAVSFEQCRAASGCSVPSHASMVSGQLPHEHGIHSTDIDFGRLDRSQTFVGDLPNHRAIGVSANEWISPEFGFDTYFDEFIHVSPRRRFPDGLDVESYIHGSDSGRLESYLQFLRDAVLHEAPLKSLGNGLLAQMYNIFQRLPLPMPLDDGASIVSSQIENSIIRTERPFVVFANYMDAHTPLHHVIGYDRELHSASNSWNSRNVNLNRLRHGNEETARQYDEFITTYRSVYAASIDYLDRTVASLIDTIQTTAPGETSFIITADHGENLCYPEDAYRFGHVSSLSEGLLHVPCYLIDPPDGYRSVEHDYFSHLDLGRLIVEMSRDRTPDVFSKDVSSELIGIGGSPEMSEDEHRYWKRMIRAAHRGDTKFVWDSEGGRFRYRLDSGSPNKEQLVSENAEIPDWACDLFDGDIREVKRRMEEAARGDYTADISDETRNRLEELGYL